MLCVMWFMSPVLVMDPTPAYSPTMHSRMVCKDPSTMVGKDSLIISEPKLQIPFITFPYRILLQLINLTFVHYKRKIKNVKNKKKKESGTYIRHMTFHGHRDL